MNGYLKMLTEYKQSEAALRGRIAELSGKMRECTEASELESLSRRKSLLEQELYDLLDVVGTLYEYAGCGEDAQCKDA